MFGVFDGHGGKEVSNFAEANFAKIFTNRKEFNSMDYKEALKQTFFELDA